jgi:NAD(P)H-hydrate epimerase
LTALQAKAIDLLAQRHCGLSTLALMENAGAAVARHACALSPSRNIAVICGKGNNGGDGFVAARHLIAAGRSVEVYAVSSSAGLRGAARANAAILAKCGQKINLVSGPSAGRYARRIASADLIIDALLGIGLNAPVRGVYRLLIEQVNASDCRVLSVDIPSGLDADTGTICGACVEADMTVTFIAPKAGMLKAEGPAMCGRIVVEPIGFPAYNKSWSATGV